MAAAKTFDEYLLRVLRAHELELCTWPGDWEHAMAQEIYALREENERLTDEVTYWSNR